MQNLKPRFFFQMTRFRRNDRETYCDCTNSLIKGPNCTFQQAVK